ncbi:MAG: hypothetical protein CVV24_08820 [Ignavibacteriae bacterium HGW-Ignavibacteriae-3]|nr:MAG: hypothetical protein CVV24_08820 [Ignavibacteriae bacterium HGW-Ignavibacteriae-3]
MIPLIRDKFNLEFSQIAYEEYLNDIWKWTNGERDFRVCETPLFIDEGLTSKLIDASNQITDSIRKEEFKRKSVYAVPDHLRVPNEDSHPLFLQVDFAITVDENNQVTPRLIELQGFPSLYLFQAELDRINRKHLRIPENFTSYFNGYDFNSYIELLKKAILGSHKPENVILLEIDPDHQKTRIDFYITKKLIGIEPVCLSKIIQKGKKLFYLKDGVELPVHRIYNRVIFDELDRRKIKAGFDFHSELEVEWAGHPNWFFKISKHSLPLIQSQYAPESYYLDQIDAYPADLENYVLKPLYSFAGSGVQVDITVESLNNVSDRNNYILQKKINYAPLIKTPDEYSRAEVRMMYVWIDKPILVNNLLRTSKGKMMGVDFNKGRTWVGSNILYHS